MRLSLAVAEILAAAGKLLGLVLRDHHSQQRQDFGLLPLERGQADSTSRLSAPIFTSGFLAAGFFISGRLPSGRSRRSNHCRPFGAVAAVERLAMSNDDHCAITTWAAEPFGGG